MTRPSKDFRSKRIKLTREDFALSEGVESLPKDPVPEETWKGITSLTDDVSLRTSDCFGGSLKKTYDLWGEWICLVLELQNQAGAPQESPIVHAAGDTVDYFQASLHNVLVGYYRLAFVSLRAAVENMLVGLHLELAGDTNTYLGWLSGNELHFGWAADCVVNHARVKQLEQDLQAAVGTDLFHPRNPVAGDEGGLLRQFFRALSRYAHGAPNHNDGDFWQSNGPVFVNDAFEKWTDAFLFTFAVSVLEARLARPNLRTLTHARSANAKKLFETAVEQIARTGDSRLLLEAVPANIW